MSEKITKQYVVDPQGNVFALPRFGVVKDGWRVATAADMKAVEERTRPHKSTSATSAPPVFEQKHGQKPEQK